MSSSRSCAGFSTPVIKQTAAFQVRNSGYGRAIFVGLLEKAMKLDVTKRLRYDVHDVGWLQSMLLHGRNAEVAHRKKPAIIWSYDKNFAYVLFANRLICIDDLTLGTKTYIYLLNRRPASSAAHQAGIMWGLTFLRWREQQGFHPKPSVQMSLRRHR